MPILYALVSRQDTVLAEYTTSKGNFHLVTMVLLKKIPNKDSRLSYVYDEHVFHYVVEQGLTYLCMTDKGFASSNAFRFLNLAKDSFISSYGLDRVQSALAYSLDADFKRTLQRHMVRISIYIYIYMERERERERDHFFSIIKNRHLVYTYYIYIYIYISMFI